MFDPEDLEREYASTVYRRRNRVTLILTTTVCAVIIFMCISLCARFGFVFGFSIGIAGIAFGLTSTFLGILTYRKFQRSNGDVVVGGDSTDALPPAERHRLDVR